MDTQKKKLWNFIALVMVAVIALLLAGINGARANGAAVQMTDENNGKTVTVKAGQAIVLRLSANPTTGYGWEVGPVDASLLAQKGGKIYEPASQDKPVVGGGGLEIFEFTALQKGETTLKLVYHRAWEKDVPAARTFQVTIEIE
jgi:inhibitor of cysteine peptidase